MKAVLAANDVDKLTAEVLESITIVPFNTRRQRGFLAALREWHSAAGQDPVVYGYTGPSD
jgi:hypothetical protein